MDAERTALTDGPVLGYGTLRCILGINFFMHGSVRIFGDYAGFIEWVSKTFQNTLLAGGPAELYAWLIPWIELILGGVLVLGFGTRKALVVGQLFMATLIFGMSLKENWETVAFQMMYALTFAVLLFTIRYNRWSVDAWLRTEN